MHAWLTQNGLIGSTPLNIPVNFVAVVAIICSVRARRILKAYVSRKGNKAIFGVQSLPAVCVSELVDEADTVVAVTLFCLLNALVVTSRPVLHVGPCRISLGTLMTKRTNLFVWVVLDKSTQVCGVFVQIVLS